MRSFIKRFARDRRGATAIEYALIVSVLSIVIAAALTTVGVKLYTLIGTAANAIH